MQKINANATAPTSVKLDVAGDSKLQVDGGPGEFVVELTSRGPDSAHGVTVDGLGEPKGKLRLLKPGQTLTVKERTEVWTSGVTHLYVAITKRPAGPGSGWTAPRKAAA